MGCRLSLASLAGWALQLNLSYFVITHQLAPHSLNIKLMLGHESWVILCTQVISRGHELLSVPLSDQRLQCESHPDVLRGRVCKQIFTPIILAAIDLGKES